MAHAKLIGGNIGSNEIFIHTNCWYDQNNLLVTNSLADQIYIIGTPVSVTMNWQCLHIELLCRIVSFQFIVSRHTPHTLE